MASDSVAVLIATIARLHLLEPQQLEELQQRAAAVLDAKHLARELMERGWLTVYQADLLLQGRGSELVLGSYILLEKLGEGGMGTVFRARNWKLGRITAIKVIRKERLAGPDAVRRFHREIRAAAQLDHPNVVRAYDADEVNGTHFFAMEYVEGVDLSRLVREHGPLPPALACEYIRQAALGLQHAHERGLVHRDIKPGNLLLARGHSSGTVKVLDMGLARMDETVSSEHSATLTQVGMLMGTPDFMAPEQSVSARHVDTRADLYSLGCTLYFLLTGSVPFPGGSLTEKLLKHQMEQPKPIEILRPDAPAAVTDIAYKLLAKKPAERFQTPGELAEVLARLQQNPQLLRPATQIVRRRSSAPTGKKDGPTNEFHTDPFWQGIVAKTAPQTIANKGAGARKPWMIVGAVAGLLVLGTALALTLPRAAVNDPAKPPIKLNGKNDQPGRPWRVLPLITDAVIDKNWAHIGGGGFVVDGDSLRTECDEQGIGLLVYHKERFGNCQLRIVYKCKDSSSNSGVYVRIDDRILDRLKDKPFAGQKNEDGTPSNEQAASLQEHGPWYAVHHGFEVQICDAAGEFQRTGSIYSLAQAAPKEPPSGWRTMVITLQENLLLVECENERVTTFDSESQDVPKAKQWYESKREPKRPQFGYIGLQNHKPGDIVWFKEISVRALDGLPTQPKTTSPPPFEATFDLLSLIDPAKDSVNGSWWFSNGELMSDAAQHARIRVPYQPPAEYDLRSVFTRTDGSNGLFQALIGGGRQFAFSTGWMNNTVAGFGLVDGKTSSDNASTVHKQAWLQNGKRHESLIQVRKNSAKAYLDGELISELKTDFANVSLNPTWDFKDATVLGLGSYASAMVFHRVDILEISGSGRFLRPDDPAAKTAAARRGIPVPVKLRPTATLEGHTDFVYGVAFHPDGKTLISSESNAVPRLWDLPAGTFRGNLTELPNGCRRIAASPDGKMLAAASAHDFVAVWPAAGGQPVLHKDAGNCISLTFSADSKRLAYGTRDGRVVIAEPPQRVSASLAHPGAAVYMVAFSSDGKLLATGASDGFVRVWDTATWQKTGEWKLPQDWPTRGVFLPDGRLMVGTWTQPAQLTVWDVPSRTLVRTIAGFENGSPALVLYRRLLVDADKQRIFLRRITDGAILAELEGHTETVLALAFSADGKTLASSSDDKTVRLWDVADFNVYMHYGRGTKLADEGKWPEAIVAYRRAVEIDPSYVPAWNNLGHTLRQMAMMGQGKLDDALAFFHKAIDLDPKYVSAHSNLGYTLRYQGRFAEARDAYQRGLDQLKPDSTQRASIVKSIRDCEQLLALEKRLPALLDGKDRAANAAESLTLMRLCGPAKRLYRAASKFASDAFAADPNLIADNRYNAACYTTLAASGQGNDAADLNDGERQRLRTQVRDWLRAELTDAMARLTTSPAPVQKRLRLMLQDRDLAGVRDAAALAMLPEVERKEWQQLWADTAALLEKAK